MNLTDKFIHNPVLAIVVSLFILAVGIICSSRLSLRQYPDVSATVISVVTGYPGASAKDIETFITNPLEEKLASVDFIDNMTSSSSRNTSTITITFKLGTDINAALANVYSKVAAARSALPPNIRDPIIQKIDPNKTPLIYLGLLSDNMSLAKVADYFDRAIKPTMQNISGVGEIKMFGNYNYAMNMAINPFALSAHNLTETEFVNQVSLNNVYPVTGSFEGLGMNYPLTVTNQPETAKQFGDIPVISQPNNIVQADQIAKITLGEPEQKTIATVEEQPSVFLGIIPSTGGNPITLSNRINKMLENIKATLPTGLTIEKFWDSAIFIKDSLEEVAVALVETTLAVVAIMLLFLGSIRMVWVPAVTIPLSIVGTFAIMLALGFSINTFTLLAMVLAIGMVVDDAIVVLENIHRHIEDGMASKEAALIGAKEIQFPIIAMTLTLAAVFAPIGFLGGITGILFREFAFTLAGSVIISGVIALTLSPMMCSKIFQKEDTESKLAKTVQNTFNKLGNRYLTLLNQVIRWPKTIIAGMVAMSAICLAGFLFLPSNLVPTEDSGALMSFIRAPAGVNLKYMNPYIKQFSDILKAVPETKEVAMISGIQGENSAMGIGILKPFSERSKSAGEIAQSIQQQVTNITGINAFVMNPFRVPGTSGSMPVGFVVKTLGSIEDLGKGMTKLVNSLKDKSSPNYQWKIFYPNTQFKIDTPVINFKINRNHLADLGISMQNLGATLGLALSGREQGYFVMNHKRYDVLPQIEAAYRKDPNTLNNITIRTQGGKLIPLSYLVDVEYQVNPSSINHFQQLRSATLAAAALMPGYSMGEALAAMKKAAQSIFPKGTMYDYSGQSRTYMETQSNTFMLFIYAIIFIYLVLSAQYESFRDPFIIMTCVPLATFGALLLLELTGGSINMYTNIGMVTLVGLITKHGILMVDYANHLILDKNQEKLEAITNAARIRLRPIIITTAAILLAALPLALASGTGHNARNQMGWTIFGGMTVGTILSLFVVPTLFMLLSNRQPQKAK